MKTGGAICAGDVELIARLCAARQPRRIFGVGNAFGYSSFALSYACGNAPLDVIDAENEFQAFGGERLAGAETYKGTALTRRIAAEEGRDVAVHVGFSPQATQASLRGPNGTYDLAFIDGLHTSRAAVADFMGIRSALSPAAVVIFHDVGEYGLWGALRRALRIHRDVRPSTRYQVFQGQWYQNDFGTGFASWGFPEGFFRDMGPELPLD